MCMWAMHSAIVHQQHQRILIYKPICYVTDCVIHDSSQHVV